MKLSSFRLNILQFSKYNSFRKKMIYVSALLIALIIKLIFISSADSVDADAFSRIIWAENWLDDPSVITEGIWPPIHYYLVAFTIWLGGEHVVSPIVLQIVFSVATLIPLFLFTKREFTEQGAIVVCLIYFLSPIVFRNSYHALSGIPHAFFIICTMNFLSLGLRSKGLKYFVFAGLSVTIAAGLRYEAWLLIAVFTFMLLLKREIKFMIIFWFAAMIFPIFWMIGNYLAHHDFLYGLSGAYHWNVIMEGVNDAVSSADKAIRLIYFPLFFFILSGPLLILVLLFRGLKSVRKTFKQERMIWLLPFLVLFVVFVVKAFNGTLLLQHRFTILLTVLFIPFLAVLFEEGEKWRFKRTITLASLVFLPFSNALFYFPLDNLISNKEWKTSFWNLRVNAATGLTRLPKILDPEVEIQKKVLTKHLAKDQGLILDFDNWMNTSNIALNTRPESKMVFILDGSKHGIIDTSKLDEFLLKYPSGLILAKCNSKLQQLNWIKESRLNSHVAIDPQPIYRKDGISIFNYHTEIYHSILGSPLILCPDEESDDFIRMSFKREIANMSDVYFKSKLFGRSIDEQLKRDLKWLEGN